MIREIMLDTETTGLDPKDGHRVIEIGCVELVNGNRARTFQKYINPERDVPSDAVRVHGITTEFLKDKPKFAEIASEFHEFIGDATLVIHNAAFDLKFLNYEMIQIGARDFSAAKVIDTLEVARRKFPGSPASLDALCKRFNIGNEHRKFHGALLDADLLAEVYIALTGGRQNTLALDTAVGSITYYQVKERKFREARAFPPSLEEKEAHRNFLKQLKSPVWETN